MRIKIYGLYYIFPYSQLGTSKYTGLSATTSSIPFTVTIRLNIAITHGFSVVFTTTSNTSTIAFSYSY